MLKDANPKAIRLSDYQPPLFFIDKTELVVDIHDQETLVTATLHLHRNAEAVKGKTSDLVLDGQELELRGISLNGIALDQQDYQVDSEKLCVYKVPERFTLSTVVAIKPQENTSLEGLYKSKTMYCTQCEAQGFRKITYYLDRPDVMSEFTTTISADKKRYPILLSNGNPIAQGDKEDGRHFCTWHDPFKKPAYLFAIVAGDLVAVTDQFTTMSGRHIELKIFVEAKDLDKCEHAMVSLKHAMRWDEEVYGREYDLDLFMVVAVDDFNMGAMENKGLNIFNTSCVLAKPDITTDAAFQRVEGVVAHEYFHNWSGNRVTCRDWFQLSLKEGFTVFRDSQFSADMGSATVKRVEDVSLLRTAQFAEDAGPMAHPVQPSTYIEISNFYTLTVYEKGAEVVRMIYNLLGPKTFRQGTDLYFARHDGQAVTINEFVQAMADVSGRDFAQFKRWYTQAGTPRLRFTDEYNSNDQTYALTVEQSCPPTPEAEHKEPFHIPIAMGLIGSDGELDFSPPNHTATCTQAVLELAQARQTFVLNKVKERPVPSLLRGFSAPVKSRFDYSRADLMKLIQFDSDGFCRWDATQQLATQTIDDQINAFNRKGQASIDESLANALQFVLSEKNSDPAMVALMLKLPTEAYLSEIADEIQPDAIHIARDTVINHLANTMEDSLYRTYQEFNLPRNYVATAEQIGQRSLKNVALSYLVRTGTEKYQDLAFQQFQHADNMTDRLAALIALVNCSAAVAQQQAGECLEQFYKKWNRESLAMDQWFVVQATADNPHVLQNVLQLMEHPGFDINNPNKVRSLIAAFCNQNLYWFHNADGSGYQFLGDRIVQLNAINPQIAARLLTPLTRWRKYPRRRQDAMKAQLQRILELPNVSKDVYEVASKSLV